MWRFVTAISAATVAAVVMSANLAPADARSAGPGPGSAAAAHPAGPGPGAGVGPHPAGAGPSAGAGPHQHLTIGRLINSCPMPACRTGGTRGTGGPIGAMGPHPRVDAGPHPAMVQHFTVGSMVNPCSKPVCKSGGIRGIHDPAGAVGPHPPVTQHPMTESHHECGKDPHCHHHHHHEFNNFTFFGFNNRPYIYHQPEPDCWVWSQRLHRWIWACGPYYPSYY
jgi:hypothetical protein